MTLKTIIAVMRIIIPIFVLCCALLWLFQDRLIFFPQKTNPGTLKHFSRFNYSLNINGQVLSGWFINKNTSPEKPLIIYYGGNAEEVSGNLYDTGLFKVNSFLFINYRGFGNSTGKPSEKALLDDAIKIVDHMVKVENIPLENIILMGRSLGSGVATHVANLKKVRGVILVTPFDSLLNIAKKHYPIFPVSLLLRHRFDSASSAPEIKVPALFVVGKNDSVIPNKNSHALYRKWGGEKKIVTIPGADHNNISGYKQYWDAINNFTDSLEGN